MIRNKYDTGGTIEIGDRFEFCIGNKVRFGKVISINKEAKSCDFAELKNRSTKKGVVYTETGLICCDVTAIRGIGIIENFISRNN